MLYLNLTSKEMRELFHPGIISSLRFLTDDMGNRRGTAMVRLQSRAQAEEAIRNVSLCFQRVLTASSISRSSCLAAPSLSRSALPTQR